MKHLILFESFAALQRLSKLGLSGDQYIVEYWPLTSGVKLGRYRAEAYDITGKPVYNELHLVVPFAGTGLLRDYFKRGDRLKDPAAEARAFGRAWKEMGRTITLHTAGGVGEPLEVPTSGLVAVRRSPPRDFDYGAAIDPTDFLQTHPWRDPETGAPVSEVAPEPGPPDEGEVPGKKQNQQ